MHHFIPEASRQLCDYGKVSHSHTQRHSSFLPLFFLSMHRQQEETVMARSYKGMRLQYKGKSFGLILLLAFSAALFGVVAVQKLREKQVLNTLLKEHDKELSAFQILLQERDQAQDSRRKTEEMKDMIDTLSSQKKDLEGWILEMESTVSSLKEDRRTKAAALEDRAKEIKTLREREMDISKNESEEASLREILRMKRVEMQESKGRHKNVASLDKKVRSESAEQKEGSSDEDYDQNRGGQDNSDNSSQDQQQSAADDSGIAEVVNASESNGGVDRGNSEDGMKFEVADEADKVLAQPVRHGGGQLSRKRLKRMRMIARNQRMGKRGNRRMVRGTRGYQAQGGNVRERSTTKTMNWGFGSTGFNNGEETSKIQSTTEISFEKSADESHQEENKHGDGEDGVKQPKSDDAGSNKSEDRSESLDSPNMTENDRNLLAGDEMARMENTDLIESTDNSSRETKPEDTKQHEANNNWNSFHATPEEKEEEKIDKPEF